METIRTVYRGHLRTEATHVKSGQKIITDAPVDNHGKGEAFSPTDLMCASLGSCMMTLMGIASETHSINIEGTSMKITKIMAAEPRRVSQVVIEINMTGKSYSDKEKTILEKAARTCPVALSLSRELVQSLTFLY